MLYLWQILTPSKHIYYALHLYFSGLSLRKTSEHLLPFVKRNHVSINQELDTTLLLTNKDMAEEENENIAIHYYR
jgi:hypothetical protein